VLSHLQNLLRRHDVSHLLAVQLGLASLLCGGAIAASANALTTPAGAHLKLGAVAPNLPRSAAAQPQATLANAPADAAAASGVIRLQDLTPDQARLWNASHPVSTGPNPAAKPFKLATEGMLDEARALDCMTAAIYYEAGFESVDGQRAVAQVVINRMRNPLFPKTVCGVVFQGSDKTTGCQFTFTCDGSLARKPADAAWDRSRKVAEAALLHGYVMKKVGNATHYHADYVAPYWSPSLVKVAVVGQHIFYRWTGGLGLPPAFAGRYAGGEMKGLQIATLDGLARGAGKVAVAAAMTPKEDVPEPPTATVKAAPAATPSASDGLVTADSVAEDAKAVVKAEDLDWQGRPRNRTAPHFDRPQGGFGGPGGLGL
jgi:spore germination cell wall hydrolase CwlJ-like protein